MPGYTNLFKETLSPCYDNTQKLGWHGGNKKKKTKKKTVKRKTKKKTVKRKQRGGDRVPTCQSTVPAWHNRGEPQGRAFPLSTGINTYQFTRLTPNNQLYTAGKLVKTPICGKNYPDFVPKTGGAKKRRGIKVTIGKDGRKYYFKNGKRVKNQY